MATTTFIYERITAKIKKSYRCTDCGRTCNKTEVFGQTLNPFNRNEDGSVKDRYQIRREVDQEAEAWQPDPHCGCLRRANRDERPDVRKPRIPQTEASTSTEVHELLTAAGDLYKQLAAIEVELQDRLVGLRIQEKDKNNKDRKGYLTGLYLDRDSCSEAGACLSVVTWQESRANPRIEYNEDQGGFHRDIERVTILPAEEETA